MPAQTSTTPTLRHGSPVVVLFAPLAFGALAALAAGPFLPPFLWMWTLSVAVFAGFKWATFAQTCLLPGRAVPRRRTLIYLLLWPGMDAYGFLFVAPPRPNRGRVWTFACVKTVFGAGLFWGVARWMGGGLLTGWIGMVGMIFLLHFGSFDLLARFWQSRGFDAEPLMHNPVRSASLGEFWGRRWNSGFRDLVFGLWFARLKGKLGARGATLVLFLFSGVVHDLVISVPARGGYGWPTAYFTLQGAGLLLEHARGSALARWRGHWPGRLWTWAMVAGPAFWLFHPPFVHRVILPFMRAVYAL